MTSSNVIIAFYPYVSMSKKTHAAIGATVLTVTDINVINAEGIYFGNTGHEVPRSDPLLFFKPAHPTFQARFRQAACSASHNSL